MNNPESETYYSSLCCQVIDSLISDVTYKGSLVLTPSNWAEKRLTEDTFYNTTEKKVFPQYVEQALFSFHWKQTWWEGGDSG